MSIEFVALAAPYDWDRDAPLDARPIIPITDESIAVHGEDEVFWMVYEPLFTDPEGFSDDWVCHGSWLKDYESDG